MNTNQYEIYHIYPDKDYYHENWLFRRENENGQMVLIISADSLIAKTTVILESCLIEKQINYCF